jgi:D-alanyl-D-alanine carboxypeptidase
MDTVTPEIGRKGYHMEQQNRNRQPDRRRSAPSGGKRKKRRRVRYDRILIALVIVGVLLFLMGSCTCSCVQCATGSSTTQPSEDAEATGENATADPAATQATTDVNAVSMTMAAEDIHKGNLVVVNETYEYTFPADDVTLVSVYEKRNSSYSVSSMDVQLDEETVDHLNQMMSEFSTIYGKTDLQVTSGYRSRQDQQDRYANGSSIFPGGYSDYHTARSFDLCIDPDSGLSSYYVASGDYAWISEHAAEYGFVLRYPEGKISATGVNPRSYTFHYVGLPHATYMYAHDLSLEEYVETLQSYPATAPLTVTVPATQTSHTTEAETAEDTVWTVFYVEASATGNTVINIPNSQEYTISGDNIGGFIVAYH